MKLSVRILYFTLFVFIAVLLVPRDPSESGIWGFVWDLLLGGAASCAVVWLGIGCLIRAGGGRVRLIGIGGWTLIGFLVAYPSSPSPGSGPEDVVFSLWLVYLAYLVAWSIAEPEGRKDPARWLNLVYHGGFLLLVVFGGTYARYGSWVPPWHLGYFRRQTLEMYPESLLFYAACALVCLGWLGLTAYLKGRVKPGGGQEAGAAANPSPPPGTNAPIASSTPGSLRSPGAMHVRPLRGQAGTRLDERANPD